MDCRSTGAAAVRGAIAFMSTALLAGASPALSTAATPPPPTATTGAVSSVGTSSATANGTVNPQGLATTAYFQYGTGTGYGSQSANQTVTGNLLSNPSFEGGSTTGWSWGGTAAPAAFAAQTGWASYGSYSARLTTATLPAGGYSEIDVNPYVKGVTAGTQYTVSADLNLLKLASGQHAVLYLTWRTSSGSSLGKIQAATTSALGARTLAATLTAPTGTSQAQVDVTIEGAGVADLYFDNAKLLAPGAATAQSVSALLASLSQNTTYHYRTVATSSA